MKSRSPRAFVVGSWALVITGLIHLAAHFAGRGQPHANPQEAQLIELASTHRFDMMGVPRTLMQVFDGFSLSLTILLIAAGVQNLIAVRSGLSRQGIRRLSWVGVLTGAALLALSVAKFPPPPVVLFSIVTLAFLWSALRAPSDPPL